MGREAVQPPRPRKAALALRDHHWNRASAGWRFEAGAAWDGRDAEEAGPLLGTGPTGQHDSIHVVIWTLADKWLGGWRCWQLELPWIDIPNHLINVSFGE